MTAGFHYRFKHDYAVAVTAGFHFVGNYCFNISRIQLKWGGGGNCISARILLRLAQMPLRTQFLRTQTQRNYRLLVASTKAAAPGWSFNEVPKNMTVLDPRPQRLIVSETMAICFQVWVVTYLQTNRLQLLFIPFFCHQIETVHKLANLIYS